MICQQRMYVRDLFVYSRSIRQRKWRPNWRISQILSGLMLAAIAEAARALDEPAEQHRYLILATRSAEFFLDALRPDGRLKRSWRQGKVTSKSFWKITPR